LNARNTDADFRPATLLFGPTLTAHPLGGATVGTVCDLHGRVKGHPGLYVVDGALIPGSSGLFNPSLTIAALAERCLEQSDLREALVALTHDRRKFSEPPTLRERLGSSSIAQALPSVQRPAAGWPWQVLVDAARGVTPVPAAPEQEESGAGVPTSRSARD
jgi:hypothetical protein